MLQTDQVTLEQILAARDSRVKRQSELVTKYDLPLISMSVNTPGSRKNTPAATLSFQVGFAELLLQLSSRGIAPVFYETHESSTGFGAYVVVNMHEILLKELTVQIENTHPLGRLLDYDVIGADGVAISRIRLGYPERKCLLCGEIAHACARNRTHSMEELHDKIGSMIELFRASEQCRY